MPAGGSASSSAAGSAAVVGSDAGTGSGVGAGVGVWVGVGWPCPAADRIPTTEANKRIDNDIARDIRISRDALAPGFRSPGDRG
jgi:hypothetical protein